MTTEPFTAALPSIRIGAERKEEAESGVAPTEALGQKSRHAGACGVIAARRGLSSRRWM
jgi:hypothetical protein